MKIILQLMVKKVFELKESLVNGQRPKAQKMLGLKAKTNTEM